MEISGGCLVLAEGECEETVLRKEELVGKVTLMEVLTCTCRGQAGRR